MADLSDVATALRDLISATLYPNGTGQPSAAGVGVKVYQGWPLPDQLDVDLRAGTPICHVNIFPRPEERNTTRYQADWKQASVNTPTLTLTVAGQTITVGGSVPPANNPHNAVVIANGKPYVYPVQVSDTLATIAAALAALIAADIGGTSAAGAVITLPGSARINAARIGVNGTSVREVRRQERMFQIGIWADSPGNRDAIVRAIDPVLAATTFLTLADGSAGRLVYRSSPVTDQLEKDRLYRRDLFYTVEFGTLQVETETQITEAQLNVSAAPSGVLPYQPITTFTS